MIVPLNVNRLLKRTAAVYSDKVAVIDQDVRFTYQEMQRRVQRLSNALKSVGVEQGDRVAWLGYNNYPILEAYYGVTQFGAILVPLNIRLLAEEIAAIIDDAEPKVLVFDSDFEPIARMIGQSRAIQLIEIQISAAHNEYVGYEEWLSLASDSEAGAEFDENAPAEIFYTSGTTGNPKGVILTHRNLYLHGLEVSSMLGSVGFNDASVLLHTIPLFHVNGWGSPHYVTALGATHVMLRTFDPTQVFQLIEQHKVTHANLVPTMINMLISSPRVADFDLSSFRHVMVGGAPTPSSFIERAKELMGIEVSGGYGMSETSPVVSIAVIKSTLKDAQEARKNQLQGTAGIPLPGMEVSILNDDGQHLEWNGSDVGELAVRGNGVMQGYWNRPEETASTFYDGWLLTGDMATIDPEGYIHIVDRKKDIIISGGENISSAELEDVLYGHPAIAECCVIGRPSPEWGEIPHAVVVLRPNMTVTEDELTTYAAQHLARFKRIKSVQIVESLPKTGTGKLQKRAVRQQYGGGWSS